MEKREDKLKTLVLIGSILALVGLGLSIYSLMHHIELKQVGHTSFSCNINEEFSCDDVVRSKFSEDPWGNPLGAYGIGYFVGLLALLVTARVRPESQRDSLQAYSAMVVIGVLVSLTFGGISHFVVGHMCPTCIAIYFVTFVQLLILFFTREAVPGPWSFKSMSNGGWYGISALAVVIALYQIFKPHPSNLTLDNPKTLEEIAQVQQEQAQQNSLGPLAMLDSQVSDAVKIDASSYSGFGEDYRVGSDDAKVKIVEFADFQCPACANASRVVKQLHSEFGDRILIAFKNYPLDNSCNPSMNAKMHQYACDAAITARCAGQIGKFWDMYYKIFENQTSIDPTRLLAWSKEAGLTEQQINDCKASKDILNKIQDDVKQANAAGLQGTPTLFINGKKFNGQPEYENLRAVVQALLDN